MNDMKRQQRSEASGPLAGHVRKGRRYLSPLAATGVLTLGDWVRDDLPDLLWPVLALAEHGSSGAIKFVRWQEAVQRDLAGMVEPQVLADGLDGRFTSLDRLLERCPIRRVWLKIELQSTAFCRNPSHGRSHRIPSDRQLGWWTLT